MGLLINFNVPLLKEGIYRRILSADHASNRRVIDYAEKAEPPSTLR